MSESENVALMKDAYAAFDRGDLADLIEMFAPDVEWNWPTVKEIPHSGPRRGRHEVRQFFEALAAVEEPVESRRDEFLAQGDRVVVLGTYRACARATGRKWETDVIQVWTIRDAQIARLDVQYNTAAAVDAYRAAAATERRRRIGAPGEERFEARGSSCINSSSSLSRPRLTSSDEP